jgi:hypothetical protein
MRNSQAPQKTVDDHINKLKVYNDLKDVAQELMGMVAENHGVPVATLYDGQYGVTSKD